MEESSEYVVVHTHRGINVYALKIAVPTNGDSLGYFTKTILGGKREFNTVQAAVDAIEEDWK